MDFIKKYVVENNLILKTDNVKSKYLCSICKKILSKPTITECGHSFCYDCLKNYLETVTEKCPDCFRNLQVDSQLLPDIRMINKILELLLKCPNHLCSDEILVKDMEAHIINCEYRTTLCPLKNLGCSEISTKKNIQDHLDGRLDDHLSMIVKSIKENEIMIDSFKNNTSNKFLIMENDLKDNMENLRMLQMNIVSIKCEFNDSMKEIKNKFNEINQNSQKMKLLKNESNNNAKKLKLVEKDNMELKNRLKEIMKTQEEFKRELNIFQQQKNKNTVNKNESADCSKKLEENGSIFYHGNRIEVKLSHLFSRKKSKYHYSSLIRVKQYLFKVGFNVCSDNRIHFRIGLVWTKGFDKLIWPISVDMSIELMNQSQCIIESLMLKPNTISKPKIADSFMCIRNFCLVSELVGNQCTVILLIL